MASSLQSEISAYVDESVVKDSILVVGAAVSTRPGGLG